MFVTKGAVLNKKLISIVTPCFNESLSVIACYNAIKDIFEKELCEYDYEHVFCDNSSSDDTVDILETIARNDARLKIIVNSRNFGILKNTYNGVMSSVGDAVLLFMPVDLQDPPSLIPEFVSKWEQGYQVVYGIRDKREENFFVAKMRKAYYKLLKLVTYVDYPLNVGDFQFVDRCVVDAMRKVDDANPFMRLMTFDCGFKSIGIKYTWRFRIEGKSKNGFISMLGQGLNGLVSFSGLPLRLSLIVGSVIASVSLLYAMVIFVLKIFGVIHLAAPGIPTIIISMFFFAGVQLFFLGVIGEYIYSIYNQVRRKPLVVEKKRINFD